MLEGTDPDGRRVILTAPAWVHVRRNHPENDVEAEDLLAAIARPTRRIRGREPGEEWFYFEFAGPSRWLKVVVHYEHDEGRIVTAFPRRAFP